MSISRAGQRSPYISDYALARGIDRYPLVEFGMLEAHRAMVEAHFVATQDEFSRELDEALNELEDSDPDGMDILDDDIMERNHLLMNAIPRLQWNAQFLVVYAGFERALNSMCDLVKHRSQLKLSYQDMNGSGRDRHLIEVG